MTDTEFMSAAGGTFTVNDTVEKVINASGIYVAEDTVFARLEINGDTGTDAKGDYISAVGTAVKAGTLIRAYHPEYFSAVTLTSGSVTLILDL